MLQPLVMLMLLGTDSLEAVMGTGGFNGRMTTDAGATRLRDPDDVRDDDFMAEAILVGGDIPRSRRWVNFGVQAAE